MYSPLASRSPPNSSNASTTVHRSSLNDASCSSVFFILHRSTGTSVFLIGAARVERSRPTHAQQLRQCQRQRLAASQHRRPRLAALIVSPFRVRRVPIERACSLFVHTYTTQV